MTEPSDLDPEMVEHMRILSATHDVMDQYREVVLTAIVDSETMVTAGVDTDNAVQQGAMSLASDIAPPLVAERFMFGDNLMLDIALGVEDDARTIWQIVYEDDQRKKKKRELGKKQRRNALIYADALVDIAEVIRQRISNPICTNCGTHVVPPNQEEH